jgi:2-polyprenyl-3-methyl-5-hydroxy-6-metoxy-1,4-benzoquinol methylase
VEDKYDTKHIARYFDELGEGEWRRLEADAPARVSFHVYRRLLERHVRPGDRVLEVGAGAGRFTIELARLGAEVVVGDVSPRQLELNREKVAEAGCERCLEGRYLLDVTDLSRFPERSFDAVVCYGGPLSYIFDRADDVLREMLWITMIASRRHTRGVFRLSLAPTQECHR